MVKKILFMAVVFVMLVASNALAFEVVEETPTNLALGLESGFVFGRDYFASYYGVTGHYLLSEYVAIKGVVGMENMGMYSTGGSLMLMVKPAFVFVNTTEKGLYAFAQASNLGPNAVNAGVGLGFEYTKFIDGFKLHTEFSYSFDRALLFGYGFKIAF